MPRPKPKIPDHVRLVKSHTRILSDQFTPMPMLSSLSSVPLANRHPNRISPEDAATAILWRSLMQLQLPMDHELWETEEAKPDKYGDYDNMNIGTGNLLPLVRKPALMNTNAKFRLDATIFAENEELNDHMQNSQSKSKVWFPSSSAEQFNRGNDGGNAGNNEAKVFNANPGVKTKKSYPEVDEEDEDYEDMLTNRDLKRHAAWYRRCFRCLCCKNEVYPAALETPVKGPRTTYKIEYIQQYVEALQEQRIPQGRAEARSTLIEAYKQSIETIHRLLRVKELVLNATTTLGFAYYYLERKLTADELKLTNKRSIIGCLIWMSAFAVQFLNGPDVDPHVKHDVKLRIEDVVGSSILLLSAVVHVEETVRSCLNIMERAIQKFVFTLKAPEEERRDSEAPLAELNPDKIDRLRRRRAKIRHFVELKKATADLYYWSGKSNKVPRPDVKFFVRIKSRGKAWVGLRSTKIKEGLTIILRSSTKLLAIIEDELTQLTNIDKATQGVIPAIDSIKKPKNFLESVVLLEKTLRSLHEFPNNLLKQSEVEELKVVGRILLDYADDMNTTLEEFSWIALESCQIVQIGYEYIRVYYKWPLPEYDAFAQDNHKRYMALWAHGPDFNATRAPPSIKEPIALFHSSIYQTILRSITLNIGDRDIVLGQKEERVPTAYFTALEKRNLEAQRSQSNMARARSKSVLSNK